MGEVNGDFDGAINSGEDEPLVHEWEFGLPNVNDITPLNQGLVPLELLSAFNISPEPYLTSGDVNRASADTISTIRGQSFNSSFKLLDENHDEIDDEDCIADEDITTESKKTRRNESPEEADSAGNGKTLKRARLVWTPQLHKRFVDVVSHLGIKNAVPKTIMQLMNVEGLSRENVASHLQKYRLYLKRMQGVNFDPAPASSSSEQQPARSPVPPVTYGGAPVVPVPVPVPMMGMGSYNGFQYNHHNHNQYNGVMQTGNKFGSVVGYHHHNPPRVTPGDR